MVFGFANPIRTVTNYINLLNIDEFVNKYKDILLTDDELDKQKVFLEYLYKKLKALYDGGNTKYKNTAENMLKKNFAKNFDTMNNEERILLIKILKSFALKKHEKNLYIDFTPESEDKRENLRIDKKHLDIPMIKLGKNITEDTSTYQVFLKSETKMRGENMEISFALYRYPYLDDKINYKRMDINNYPMVLDFTIPFINKHVAFYTTDDSSLSIAFMEIESVIIYQKFMKNTYFNKV